MFSDCKHSAPSLIILLPCRTEPLRASSQATRDDGGQFCHCCFPRALHSDERGCINETNYHYSIKSNLKKRGCNVEWVWHELCHCAHTGGKAYTGAHFGAGNGPIFLDDVHCTSSSDQLLECYSRPILSHNCLHFSDAGVGCEGVLPYKCLYLNKTLLRCGGYMLYKG